MSLKKIETKDTSVFKYCEKEKKRKEKRREESIGVQCQLRSR